MNHVRGRSLSLKNETNLNIERHLYDLQYKTISKSIYLSITEYKRILYHYASSIKKKFYKVKRISPTYWEPLIKNWQLTTLKWSTIKRKKDSSLFTIYQKKR